ncbi:MAG: GFA family protein, partial [Gammaproteobacteria bacterium]
MHKINGGCHCGNILVELELAHAPENYNPRACDCDFCRKHSAAYVSDPQGSLSCRINDERYCGWYRQGSGIAEFLICTHCGVLVAVLYRNDGQLHAAVNAKAINGGKGFGMEQSVSPKTLSASEKVTRWQEFWFHNVSILT